MKLTCTLLILFCMINLAKPCAQESKLHWQVAAKLPSTPKDYAFGVAGAIGGVHNNVLLIGGGANFPNEKPWEGGKKKYYNHLFVYHLGLPNITAHSFVFALPEPIAYSAVCSTPHGIFYAGGENEEGVSLQSHLITWDTVQSSIGIKKMPPLPHAITNASAVFQDEKIIVVGGDGNKGTSDQVYVLDLKNVEAGWDLLPPLPKPAA
ncbi:MAG: hypothetical protein RL642_388, partial [Bacteroidota bacterium]